MSADEIMMPVATEEALRRAEILTMRQMTDTLRAVQETLGAHSGVLMTIGQDMAVMKERQQQNSKLEADIARLEDRIEELRLRNARQDGAFGFASFLKDFGPWLFGLLVLAWGLFERAPHPPGH